MTGWTSAGPSVLASLLASLVEFVAALTIVLAVGIVRGWRSALLGAGAGVSVLALLALTLRASRARHERRHVDESDHWMLNGSRSARSAPP